MMDFCWLVPSQLQPWEHGPWQHLLTPHTPRDTSFFSLFFFFFSLFWACCHLSCRVFVCMSQTRALGRQPTSCHLSDCKLVWYWNSCAFFSHYHATLSLPHLYFAEMWLFCTVPGKYRLFLDFYHWNTIRTAHFWSLICNCTFYPHDCMSLWITASAQWMTCN